MCIYNVYIYIYKYHDQFSECTFTYHIYIRRRKGHLLDFLDESSSGKSDTRLGSWRMERRMGQELVKMWVWVKINMSKPNTLETTDFNLFLVIIDLPIVGLPNFDLYPCMRMAYPIIPSFICSIIPSPFHSFIDSLIHSFMHSFVRSFVRSFIHSIVHSFIACFFRCKFHIIFLSSTKDSCSHVQFSKLSPQCVRHYLVITTTYIHY